MINYDEEVIKILKISEEEAKKLCHQYVSTEHIILAILKYNNSLSNIFKSQNINYLDYKNIIINNIPKDKNNFVVSYTPLLKKIIEQSINGRQINLKSIVIKILEDENSIANTLLNIMGHNTLKLYNILKNEKTIKYGINLNKELNNELLYERCKELNELIEILCRKNKNNALIIGEAGVGKTALVEYLAQKINKKNVPKELLNKEIISINLASIVSGTKYRGEFEEKLENLINELQNNTNYILFIDEIHTVLGAGSSEGSIDAANILKPYLARNKIKCIGATTISEYNKSIKKDKALNRRFQTIIIKEPNKSETEKILISSKKYYENFHNVKINNSIIKKIVELSEQYLKDKKEPDRSLDILDIACTKVKLTNNKLIEIEKLRELKNKHIKNNEFDKAKSINLKISNIHKKNKLLTFNIIKDCYKIKNNNTSLGFKV